MYCLAYDCVNNDGDGECTMEPNIHLDENGRCTDFDWKTEEE